MAKCSHKKIDNNVRQKFNSSVFYKHEFKFLSAWNQSFVIESPLISFLAYGKLSKHWKFVVETLWVCFERGSRKITKIFFSNSTLLKVSILLHIIFKSNPLFAVNCEQSKLKKSNPRFKRRWNRLGTVIINEDYAAFYWSETINSLVMPHGGRWYKPSFLPNQPT